jgi:hypothetical protein
MNGTKKQGARAIQRLCLIRHVGAYMYVDVDEEDDEEVGRGHAGGQSSQGINCCAS